MRYLLQANRLFAQGGRATGLKLGKLRHYECLNIVAADLEAPALQTLRRRDIPVIRLGRFSLTRGLPFYGVAPPSASWNLKAMNLDTAGYTGKGVVVGLLDTGAKITHPALSTQVAAWASISENGPDIALTKNAAPGDAASRDYHGTRVAGVICGQEFEGQKGVAPGAQLSIVRMPVAYGESFSDEAVVLALDYFCSAGVRIVNISIETATEEATHEFILQAALAKSLIPIVPIGNTSAGMVGVPGKCQTAIGVGAVAESGQVYDLSGSEPAGNVNAINPDVLAPGDGVLTCAFDLYGHPLLEAYSGTSFSAPHIAGLAARMLEKDKTMTAAAVRQKIELACRPSPDPTRAVRGVPDALQALA